MTFLRVVSERFPLFTSPDQAGAKSSAGSDASIDRPLGGRFSAIEAEIPHCCFNCAQCGTPILLPHDSLGLPFGGPLIRRIEARSIGTVCPACHQAGTYSLFHGGQGYNTRHRFVAARPQGRTLLLGWLGCQEHTCVAPLPFFVTLGDEEQDEVLKNRASGWNWEQLTCTSGHEVKAPGWLFDGRSGRAPIDLSGAGTRHLR
jgi:hypothetical protein